MTSDPHGHPPADALDEYYQMLAGGWGWEAANAVFPDVSLHLRTCESCRAEVERLSDQVEDG